jgi:hypothetical protein
MFAVSVLRDGENIVILLHEKFFAVSEANLSPAEFVKNEDDTVAPKAGDTTMVVRATTIRNGAILAVISMWKSRLARVFGIKGAADALARGMQTHLISSGPARPIYTHESVQSSATENAALSPVQ